MGLSPEALANGWTQPEGDFYLKVWNRSFFGDAAFTDIRETENLSESFQDHQVNIYGEYGVLDKLTLTLSAIPVGFASFGDTDQAYFGGGAVGARYQLHSGSWVAAVSADVGVRSSVDPLGVDISTGEPLIVQPVLGTVHGSVSAGAGVPLSFGWLAFSAGARAFSRDELDPAFFAGAQFGWNTGIGLILDAHLNWYHALGEIRPIQVLGSGQTRYLGFGLGLSWWFLDRMAVTVGVDGVAYAAANAAATPFSIGLEFR